MVPPLFIRVMLSACSVLFVLLRPFPLVEAPSTVNEEELDVMDKLCRNPLSNVWAFATCTVLPASVKSTPLPAVPRVRNLPSTVTLALLVIVTAPPAPVPLAILIAIAPLPILMAPEPVRLILTLPPAPVPVP